MVIPTGGFFQSLIRPSEDFFMAHDIAGGGGFIELWMERNFLCGWDDEISTGLGVLIASYKDLISTQVDKKSKWSGWFIGRVFRTLGTTIMVSDFGFLRTVALKASPAP